MPKGRVTIEFGENGIVCRYCNENEDDFKEETYVFSDMNEATSWLKDHGFDSKGKGLIEKSVED